MLYKIQFSVSIQKTSHHFIIVTQNHIIWLKSDGAWVGPPTVQLLKCDWIWLQVTSMNGLVSLMSLGDGLETHPGWNGYRKWVPTKQDSLEAPAQWDILEKPVKEESILNRNSNHLNWLLSANDSFKLSPMSKSLSHCNVLDMSAYEKFVQHADILKMERKQQLEASVGC